MEIALLGKVRERCVVARCVSFPTTRNVKKKAVANTFQCNTEALCTNVSRVLYKKIHNSTTVSVPRPTGLSAGWPRGEKLVARQCCLASPIPWPSCFLVLRREEHDFQRMNIKDFQRKPTNTLRSSQSQSHTFARYPLHVLPGYVPATV